MRIIVVFMLFLSASSAMSQAYQCEMVSQCERLPDACEEPKQAAIFESLEFSDQSLKVVLGGNAVFEIPIVASAGNDQSYSYFFEFESFRLMATVFEGRKLSVFGTDTHGNPGVMIFNCEVL